MKTRLGITLSTAVMAAVLMVSCVPTKKYKASQATVQQLRNDSARLSQELATVNQNVQTLEQKNKGLQSSLDSSTASYAAQQKSLDYYQTYFSKQQTSMTQIGEELKNALTQAGVSNDAIQQTGEGIYITMDESYAFKKNSATATTTGKQALNGVAEVLKNHPDVNVTVTSGDDEAASMNGMSNDNISTTDKTVETKVKTETKVDKDNADNSATVDNSADTKTKVSTGKKSTTVKSKTNVVRQSSAATKTQVKRKKTYKTSGSEGYTRNFTTGSKRKSSALKTGRVNTVANNLLDGGVPKVNLMIRQPATGTTGTEKNDVKIIVSPTMTDFKPAQGTSASRLP